MSSALYGWTIRTDFCIISSGHVEVGMEGWPSDNTLFTLATRVGGNFLVSKGSSIGEYVSSE